MCSTSGVVVRPVLDYQKGRVRVIFADNVTVVSFCYVLCHASALLIHKEIREVLHIEK